MNTIPFSCQRGHLTIRGKIWGSPEGKKPAVIMSHGFLVTGDYNRSYAERLAELGFICFTFDFCCAKDGTSDGSTVDMTVPGQVEDLKAVHAYVKSLPYVDSQHITLLGASQGAVVTALAAKEIQQEAEQLVLMFPALCIPDDARSGKMMTYCFDPHNIPDLLGTEPMPLGGNYARTVIDWDIYEEVKGYTGPVLLLHGIHDALVDISYARRARSCFPDCTYAEIDGGHGFRGASFLEAMSHIEPFLGC